MKWFYGTLALLVCFCATQCFAEKGDDAVSIKNGSQVKFDYTLTVDGKKVDSSQNRGPLAYTQGDKRIIPGLSRQLEGLKAGDERDIAVAPEEAYGERDPKALREVERSKLPSTIQPEVGMPLQVQGPEGSVSIVSIAEVKKDSVVVDFNHPLAGKTLNFHIKIVSVQ